MSDADLLEEKITLRNDLDRIHWKDLTSLYELAQLGKRDPAKLRRAFEASYIVCIAFDGGKIIGAGRAISDGEYYSNIYDVAVLPDYQGSGVGRQIMDDLVGRLGELFVLLTTTIGKE